MNLLNEREARRRTDALPRGSDPRIRWAGFDLPGEVAQGNLLCVGAVGMGKTRLHRELLRSVVSTIGPDSDRRVGICDAKSDLLSELQGMMKPSADRVMLWAPSRRRVSRSIRSGAGQ